MKRGFTLVEMVVVVAVIAVAASIASVGFYDLRRSERRREIIRTVVGLSSQARTVALHLGPAARTPRAALDVSCSDVRNVFSENGSMLNARAGIAFMSGVTCSGGSIACCPAGEPTPCDLVIWGDLVQRTASGAAVWNGDNYTLFCKSASLGERDGSMLNPATFANMPIAGVAGGTARYVAFDGRGFITPSTPLAAKVGISAKVGTGTIQKAVVILASGLACLEGENFQCARMP